MSDNQVIEEMNIQYPIEDHIQTEIISMENIPEYDIQDYDIFNEKSFNKYIADIEKIVRSSFEYEEFISYLRNYMDMNKCSFFENVNNIDTTKIKISHPYNEKYEEIPYDNYKTYINTAY